MLQRRDILKLLSILFTVSSIFFSFGIIRIIPVFSEKSQDHISHFLETKISFKGKIDEEVDEREDKIKYTLEVFENNGKKAYGRILLDANKFPVYEYGDILEVKGELKTPPEDEEFSYKNYLSRYEIYGIIQNPRIKKIGHEPSSKIFYWLFKNKKKFLNKINEQYSEPYSSFLSGLLIGARKGMSTEITKDFQVTGLAHIVAVSGSNITIILAIVITLLGFMPRIISFIISLIFIILFTIFVGMSAAVVRAAIMGIIGLVAVQTGNPKTPSIAMLLTITIMAMWQPKMLVYDVGFQLSVLAVVGVIWLVPLLPNFFQKLPEKFGIKEAIAMTMAAQITTMPVTIINFKTFSIVAPIANLFVVPQIPLAMLFGFLSLIPIPFISDVFTFITFIFLKLSLFFAQFFARIPYAQISDISVPRWIWLFYFLFLGFIFWRLYGKDNSKLKQEV